MFEFFIVKNYLTPPKKRLSVSLIALMSTLVISLVVWLVLIFLSITEGIEKNWLEKLTSLHAPLRIQPTEKYFSSYYYQVDPHCISSNFTHKTIEEKALSGTTNPYNPERDFELPSWMPQAELERNGTLKDPVKEVYRILANLKNKVKGFTFQEYELSGALMRLTLTRPETKEESSLIHDHVQSFLTQASYLASLPDRTPFLANLLIPPKIFEINHLLHLAVKEKKPEMIRSILQNIALKKVEPRFHLWNIPESFFPEKVRFCAVGEYHQNKLIRVIIPLEAKNQEGVLYNENGCLFFCKQGEMPIQVSSNSIFLRGKKQLQARFAEQKNSADPLKISLSFHLQNHSIEGEMAFSGFEIVDATIFTNYSKAPYFHPSWLYKIDNSSDIKLVLPDSFFGEKGVLLVKNFQDNGVMVGDRGFLSYTAPTVTSIQEQRIPIYVAGFYDPGVIAIGNKCIITSKEIPHLINMSNSGYSLEKNQSNGIQIWFSDLKQVDSIQKELQNSFLEAGIQDFWKIQSFKQYDFSKDLIEQFQSDKYLFSLIGLIILAVACCNIISLLIILVSDKKREIGIMQALGASKKSIAAIFGMCGMVIGILSSVLGTVLAMITLKNINFVVHVLSAIQGRETFNAIFFGKSLPTILSNQALYFVLIATPIIALLAGLIPAIQACRIEPSSTLKSE
ncbi:MAG: FtsX-like permease family protein [Chlamydiae bacterium]|nr:FtsX-like permease family protein [Chlamydiota bacterium]